MRVVIVDDCELLRHRLAMMLAEFPGEAELVGQARDPGEALETIRRLRPDVVTLDIRMPGGSGIEVLRAVKEEMPGTTVIMFTSYPYPQYRKKCMAAGADYFLEKGTDFARLPELFKRLFHERCAC